MTKVLIISYFFPPANFVGAERTAAWAKYLKEFGVYPIIITRNWNENQTDLTDKVIHNEYTIEKTENYEIRRIPYRHSLRDKLATKKKFRFLQKTLTLKELILSNFFISSLPYANFYEEAKKVLHAEKNIVAVIASGRPFQSFAIGYQLKKEFPKIKWIPDYRDEWTTHRHNKTSGLLKRMINFIEQKSELKWTSNANFFISVSNGWVSTIECFNKKKGVIILNGYNQMKKIKTNPINHSNFVITYAGTIYETQNIDIVIDACISLIKKGINIELQFIGANISPRKMEAISSKIDNFESNFKFIPRLSKEQLFSKISSTDLLFLTGFAGITNWYPVKLFEYYASGKPVLLCPSDNNVMEEFILKSNCGFVTNTEQECVSILLHLLKQKKQGELITLDRNTEYGSQFSRRNQTRHLAEILSKL